LLLRITDWVLYTSLFTTCCALGLCMATERLINGISPAICSNLHALVFGSTLVVYNMPRIARRPLGRDWVLRYRPWHFILFFTGILLTATGLYTMPWQMVICSSILGFLAFAYSLPLLPFKDKKRLRDFGWLKITVLAGVWTIATSVLPILYWHKSISDYPIEVLLRLLFIFTLCIIFDIRDMQADERDNIKTLPQKVGIINSYRLINTTLILFIIFSIVQYIHFHEPERLVGALLTAIITRAVVFYLKKNPSDRGYNILADGVMLLYACLILIPKPF